MDDRRRLSSRGPESDPWRPPFAPSDPHTAGRVEADEVSADEARRRLHAQGIVPIEPDDRIGVMLGPDELLLAMRPSVMLERRQRCRDDAPGLGGDLYVTSRRLVHLGRGVVAYPLDDVREALVAADRLMLVVGENLGVALRVDDPRLLRVEIAAARAAARAQGRAARWAADGGPLGPGHDTRTNRGGEPRADPGHVAAVSPVDISPDLSDAPDRASDVPGAPDGQASSR